MIKTNKRFRHRHLVFFRLKTKDRQQQKEERSKEEDRREGGNQTESKEFQQRILKKKKKRVTVGEVDELGKEPGNCTHQWTTNDDTNKQALSTLSLLQVKQQKEERSREEDRREGGN